MSGGALPDLLILAAGDGRRLGSAARGLPKPLVPVAGRPVIDYVADALDGVGVRFGRRAVITNHGFVPAFRGWCGMRGFELIDDGTTSPQTRLGGIGDMAVAIREAGLGTEGGLFVAGGDMVFTRGQGAFLQAAMRHGIVTALHDVGSLGQVRRFAEVDTGPDGEVRRYVEKPTDPQGTLASIMLYWIGPGQLSIVEEYLGAGGNPDQCGRLLAWALAEGKGLHGLPVEGAWFDIGDPAALAEAEGFLQGRP